MKASPFGNPDSGQSRLEAAMRAYYDIRTTDHDLTDHESRHIEAPQSSEYFDATTTYVNTSHGWTYEPKWSAGILVAQDKESIDNVLFTLDEIRKASEGDAGPVEVTLWFNSRIAEGQLEGPFLSGAMETFDDLVEQVKMHNFSPDTIRIRARYQLLLPHESFNELRANSTYFIAREGVDRRFSPDHPIFWFDADKTFIGRRAVPLMIKALEEKQAHFVHANNIWTADRHAPPLPQQTPAEKAAAIYGLTRRMLEQQLDFTSDRGYVDESGLAFTLETYLCCGGVSIRDPALGESRTLIARGLDYLDLSIPLVGYINEARIGLSNRRLPVLLNSVSAWELPGLEDGADYIDFQSLDADSLRPRDGPITLEEVQTMIERMIARQQERTATTLSPAQRSRLEAIVARCAFAKE